MPFVAGDGRRPAGLPVSWTLRIPICSGWTMDLFSSCLSIWMDEPLILVAVDQRGIPISLFDQALGKAKRFSAS